MGELVSTALNSDLQDLIAGARQRVAVTANRELALLYWRVGRRIHAEVLGEERAPYGQEIVATASRQLVPAYGRGFERKNLYRMIQFARTFPEAITHARQRTLALGGGDDE